MYRVIRKKASPFSAATHRSHLCPRQNSVVFDKFSGREGAVVGLLNIQHGKEILRDEANVYEEKLRLRGRRS
jgi:hypothetical protein